MAVSFLGKIKTASQMIAIPMLLFYDDPLGPFDPPCGSAPVLIYIAAALTLISMFYYLQSRHAAYR